MWCVFLKSLPPRYGQIISLVCNPLLCTQDRMEHSRLNDRRPLTYSVDHSSNEDFIVKLSQFCFRTESCRAAWCSLTLSAPQDPMRLGLSCAGTEEEEMCALLLSGTRILITFPHLKLLLNVLPGALRVSKRYLLNVSGWRPERNSGPVKTRSLYWPLLCDLSLSLIFRYTTTLSAEQRECINTHWLFNTVSWIVTDILALSVAMYLAQQAAN